METPDHYKKVFTSSGLKQNSVSTYIRNIKKLYKEHFNCEKLNPLFLKDHQEVVDYIDSLPSNASKKTMCTSIIVMLKSCDEIPDDIKQIYSKKLTSIAYEQNQVYIENQKSEKEDKNWVTNEEIKEKLECLKKKSEQKTITDRQRLVLTQKYLILTLYTEIPPLRNDYAYTCVFEKTKDIPEDHPENYIDLETSTLHLKVYKTAKFYGDKKINIPKKVMTIIKKFEKLKKQIKDDIGHNYLLVKCDFEPMNKLNLTKTLNKIFHPKKVSTTILRKVYLSYKYPIQHSINEMQQDADIMGHDFMTARKIYTKIT